jgi:hypothetical protein
VGIEIVNLVLLGPYGTVVKIQSDEPKRRMVVLSVHSHIVTNHESHVGLEAEGRKTSAGTDAPNPIKGDESVEVRNLRRIGKIIERP